MTIDIENAPTSADSLPTILWNNIFASGTLSASSEATGYPKENAISEATYNAWQPTTLPATLTVDYGAPVSVDSSALVAHDCGTKNNTIQFQSSTDNVNWTTRSTVSPLDDTTILTLFPSASARYWRMSFTARNMFQYTEQFNNAYWLKTRTTATADTTTAPDNTLTADSIIEDTSTSTHLVSRSISYVAGETYTMSFYAKPIGARNIRIDFPSAAFGGTSAGFFDITNGTVISTTGSVVAAISNAGNGWYRCSITKTATTTTSAANNIYVVSGTTTTSYTGDGVSGFYLWGSQLELGSQPTTYVKVDATSTTNRPFVGVAMAGARFNFPAGVLPPYTPVWLSQTYELLTATTIGGQFLGNRVLRQGGKTTINLVAVERSFGESTILPFREHYNTGKAFVWAAGPSVFTKDVGYVWRTENSVLAPTYDDSGTFMSVGMEVYAYGE